MDNELITIRLDRHEWFALELLLERLRERYPKVEKVYGQASKMDMGLVEVDVFQDEFDAIEVLDNVLRMRLKLEPFK